MTYDLSNLLEYNGYLGTVEFSLEDNVLHGRVVGIDGIISYEGNDLESLKQDFEIAVNEYIDMCEVEAIKPQRPYFSQLNIRIPPALHKNLASYSARHNKTLNETVEEALTHYITA